MHRSEIKYTYIVIGDKHSSCVNQSTLYRIDIPYTTALNWLLAYDTASFVNISFLGVFSHKLSWI